MCPHLFPSPIWRVDHEDGPSVGAPRVPGELAVREELIDAVAEAAVGSGLKLSQIQLGNLLSNIETSDLYRGRQHGKEPYVGFEGQVTDVMLVKFEAPMPSRAFALSPSVVPDGSGPDREEVDVAEVDGLA